MVNVRNLSTFEKVKRGFLILPNKCSERRVLVNVSVVIEVKQYYDVVKKGSSTLDSLYNSVISLSQSVYIYNKVDNISLSYNATEVKQYKSYNDFPSIFSGSHTSYYWYV